MLTLSVPFSKIAGALYAVTARTASATTVREFRMLTTAGAAQVKAAMANLEYSKEDLNHKRAEVAEVRQKQANVQAQITELTARLERIRASNATNKGLPAGTSQRAASEAQRHGAVAAGVDAEGELPAGSGTPAVEVSISLGASIAPWAAEELSSAAGAPTLRSVEETDAPLGDPSEEGPDGVGEGVPAAAVVGGAGEEEAGESAEEKGAELPGGAAVGSPAATSIEAGDEDAGPGRGGAAAKGRGESEPEAVGKAEEANRTETAGDSPAQDGAIQGGE